MTDDNRDWLRDAIGRRDDEQIPKEAHEGITREFLERWSASWSRSRGMTYEQPGEVLSESAESNIPRGVGDTVKTRVTVTQFPITRAQADQLGITDGELPGVYIVDTPKEEK